MSGKHAKAKVKKATVVRIGGKVHSIRKPRRRGLVLGWDVRNIHQPIYYIKER